MTKPTGRPKGRPSKRPALDVEILLYRIRSGDGLTAAAAEQGITSRTIQRWMERDDELLHAVKRAQAERDAQRPKVESYPAGCRCANCKAANAARKKRENLARKARPEETPHGLTGYFNWMCRCPVCKAAGSEANRAAALRRKTARKGH